MPLISFIIPYYNVPMSMLHECIQSIFALKLGNEEIEVIVIDDGSVQSPRTELECYDSCIYVRQENGGPGAARNKGVEIAKGEYIQFIDSDDYLLPSYLSCLDIIKQERPDIVMFHCKPTKYYLKKCSGPEYMLGNNVRGAACGLVFRRDILHGLRYATTIINEDELFNAHLILHANSLVDVGVHAYYYRFRRDSRSHNISMGRIVQRLNDAETIICSLKEFCGELSGIKKLALERRTRQLAMDYLFNIVQQTNSLLQLCQRCRRLKAVGLYPLQLKHYTWKYMLFSLFTYVSVPFLRFVLFFSSR